MPKSFRTSDPAKWNKAIYDLSGVNSQHEGLTANSMVSEAALAEKLQISFTEPWKDLITTSIPQIDDVESLLKDYPPPLPTILAKTIDYTLDIFAPFDVPDCQFISNDPPRPHISNDPPRPQNNVESLPNALNMLWDTIQH